MFKKIAIAAAALISVSGVLATNAAAGTPRLDQRQQHQAERIRQGVRSGELTRPETRRLVHGQRELRQDERIAKSDGVVTARERARLQHEANQQSRRIYRQKHDAQDRN